MRQHRHVEPARSVIPPATSKPHLGRRPRPEGLRQVDAYVGSRVRLRRTIKGLSQTDLGSAIGLTFQQVQKYESGANRIGASRLFQLGEVLDVPVSFFFDGVKGGDHGEAGATEAREIATRETMMLARAVERLPAKQRRSLIDLARSLAGTKEG
jgi:transcriptional regulator with XRE-family HTH domain